MTAITAGAPARLSWPPPHLVDTARAEVRRLQVRIAKAVQLGRWGKVKALQRLLTRSFHARVLAVQRVTSNKGRRTPGVDGVLWTTPAQRQLAAQTLHPHAYKPRPLRRLYIPKKNGKKRPLSIPTMRDRAMQALFKLALAPVAETTADPNSYGFREGRSCADAVQAAFIDTANRFSAPWIFEADIQGCFDNISHEWLLDNIPMEKPILKAWLNAGYMEGGHAFPTRKGTPQGGIISPTLANMTLDGLEAVVKAAVPRRSRVNLVRYADDFIITGKSRTLLETHIRPAVERFLAERGLTLSAEKTHITHIRRGFTFLGQTFRKRGRAMRVTPSREAVQSLLRRTGDTIRRFVSMKTPALIGHLNRMLRGWGNYHRFVVSSETFRKVDRAIFQQLWRMLTRRHPNKSKGWIIQHYFRLPGRPEGFSAQERDSEGNLRFYRLFRLVELPIRRHVKIRAQANPYLPEYAGYFWQRRHNREARSHSMDERQKIRAVRNLGG